MLAFLAVNTTYRGPATPGSAAALAFGLAVPDENTMLIKKLRGGIGVLHRASAEKLFTAAGGELRLRSHGRRDRGHRRRVTGVRTEDGYTVSAPRRRLRAWRPTSPSTSWSTPDAVPPSSGNGSRRIDHRGSYLQMHFALDGVPAFAAPYEVLNDPEDQAAIGIFTTPEELQQQWEDSVAGIVPADPAVAYRSRPLQRPRPGARRQGTRRRRSRCGSRSRRTRGRQIP